jgi:hypothetical protein
VLGRPMGYHDNHWKKNKVTLQRRVMIQNLSNLTKKLPLRSITMQGAVSIEITEIIWICNAMGFFFKFGKQIEENIGFNI